MEELFISPNKLEYNPMYVKMKIRESWVYSNFFTNISVVGIQHPIVIDDSFQVIDGNKRLQVSIELGISIIPVIIKRRVNRQSSTKSITFKPSELIVVLDVFERKYGLTQYSQRKSSEFTYVLRGLLFRNKKRLRLYYDLKRLLSYLSPDDLTTYLSKIDNGEISEDYLVRLLQQKRNDDVRLDFKLFSMEDRSYQILAA